MKAISLGLLLATGVSSVFAKKDSSRKGVLRHTRVPVAHLHADENATVKQVTLGMIELEAVTLFDRLQAMLHVPIVAGIDWSVELSLHLRLAFVACSFVALCSWLVAPILWFTRETNVICKSAASMNVKEKEIWASKKSSDDACYLEPNKMRTHPPELERTYDTQSDARAHASGSESAASYSACYDTLSATSVEDPGKIDSHWKPRTTLPTMKDARKYYPYMLPVFLFLAFFPFVVSWSIVKLLAPTRFFKVLLEAMPVWLLCAASLLMCGGTLVKYIWHFKRIQGNLQAEVPRVVPGAMDPLFHVVVVVAYKEPLEVLQRTFASILNQTGIARQPMMVLATERRDETRHACARAVAELCHAQGRRGRFMLTEHLLEEDETIGKHSNENWAVREIYKQLVETEGLDPFEVMVTIVDADSIVSKTYLANVENYFRAQRDGRRLIYNGPLNTYRNFASACLLAQIYELMRCHADVFFEPLLAYYPQSNYSLTLGLCHETDYWMNDVMPEDIHTCNKAMLNNVGSWCTVPVPSFICNDLVTDFRDRYVQAKRHQWGITETFWILALFWKMEIPFNCFWASVKGELLRDGSFVGSAVLMSKRIMQVWIAYAIYKFGSNLEFHGQLFLGLILGIFLFQWVVFWCAELILWRTQMPQFQSLQWPSVFNVIVLVAFSPLLQSASEVAFFIIPTIDCLIHAAFVGELAYICAPKGDAKEDGTNESVVVIPKEAA